MKLSYSTINMLHTASHIWVNRLLGIPRVDYPWFSEGRTLHRIVQGHVSGKRPVKELKEFTDRFPLVEEVDFDDRLRFTLPWHDGHELFGFIDGIDHEGHRLLEIKTGTMYSLGKFGESMQRKIYQMAFPTYSMILFTCNKTVVPYKTYEHPAITEHEMKSVVDWVNEGIDIIEKNVFTGGLDANGKCAVRYCEQGDQCHFK